MIIQCVLLKRERETERETSDEDEVHILRASSNQRNIPTPERSNIAREDEIETSILKSLSSMRIKNENQAGKIKMKL